MISMKKERLKVIVLTEKDRKLLQGIHKSLDDIKKGRVKPFLAEELKRHK